LETLNFRELLRHVAALLGARLELRADGAVGGAFAVRGFRGVRPHPLRNALVARLRVGRVETQG
jgi:hypothetical protein